MWIVSHSNLVYVNTGIITHQFENKEDAEKYQFDYNKSLVDNPQYLDEFGKEIYEKLMYNIKNLRKNYSDDVSLIIYNNFVKLLIDHLLPEVKATMKCSATEGLWKDSAGHDILKYKDGYYYLAEITNKCRNQFQAFTNDACLEKYDPAKEGK